MTDSPAFAAFGRIKKCPGWDSNPHCMAFEAIACCRLGYRGPAGLTEAVGRMPMYRTGFDTLSG